jgi:two-component system alkaline phosphatase synthesis response regulator PhoP
MGKELQVLLITDDAEALIQQEDWLIKAGYGVFSTANIAAALKFAIAESPVIILIDLQLKDVDGIDFVAELRDEHFLFHSTIVVMAEKGETFVQVAAFNAGADDYVVKPFKKHWFDGKLKAWTRRFTGGSPVIKSPGIEGLEIDADKYTVMLLNKQYVLSHREFEILNFLLRRPGKVFTRGQIKSAVWKSREKVRERTIDVHIHKLREKLGSRYITTIKGVGYRFDF